MIQKHIPVVQGGNKGRSIPPVIGIGEIDTETKILTIQFVGPEIDEYISFIEEYYEVALTMTGKIKKHIDGIPVIDNPVEHIEPS